MNEYSRKYPEFSLCGLNCVLCPRFQTDGKSKCPGCGGKDFTKVHPVCSVITCNRKHGNNEFCYECNEFPCAKYDVPMIKDSFISKKFFMNDISAAKRDILKYLDNIKEKQRILEKLIEDYNDGRAKSYYCIAVNLLPLDELIKVMDKIKETGSAYIGIKDKTRMAKGRLEAAAKSLDILIELRK